MKGGSTRFEAAEMCLWNMPVDLRVGRSMVISPKIPWISERGGHFQQRTGVRAEATPYFPPCSLLSETHRQSVDLAGKSGILLNFHYCIATANV